VQEATVASRSPRRRLSVTYLYVYLSLYRLNCSLTAATGVASKNYYVNTALGDWDNARPSSCLRLMTPVRSRDRLLQVDSRIIAAWRPQVRQSTRPYLRRRRSIMGRFPPSVRCTLGTTTRLNDAPSGSTSVTLATLLSHR